MGYFNFFFDHLCRVSRLSSPTNTKSDISNNMGVQTWVISAVMTIQMIYCMMGLCEEISAMMDPELEQAMVGGGCVGWCRYKRDAWILVPINLGALLMTLYIWWYLYRLKRDEDFPLDTDLTQFTKKKVTKKVTKKES